MLTAYQKDLSPKAKIQTWTKQRSSLVIVITTILAVEIMRFLVNFYFNYFQGHEISVIGQLSFVHRSGECNVNNF